MFIETYITLHDHNASSSCSSPSSSSASVVVLISLWLSIFVSTDSSFNKRCSGCVSNLHLRWVELWRLVITPEVNRWGWWDFVSFGFCFFLVVCTLLALVPYTLASNWQLTVQFWHVVWFSTSPRLEEASKVMHDCIFAEWVMVTGFFQGSFLLPVSTGALVIWESVKSFNSHKIAIQCNKM